MDDKRKEEFEKALDEFVKIVNKIIEVIKDVVKKILEFFKEMYYNLPLSFRNQLQINYIWNEEVGTE